MGNQKKATRPWKKRINQIKPNRNDMTQKHVCSSTKKIVVVETKPDRLAVALLFSILPVFFHTSIEQRRLSDVTLLKHPWLIPTTHLLLRTVPVSSLCEVPNMGTCTRNTSYLWNVNKCIMRRLCADQCWQTVSPIRYFPGQPSHHQCCYFIGFSQMPGDSTTKQHIASKSLDFRPKQKCWSDAIATAKKYVKLVDMFEFRQRYLRQYVSCG